MARHPAAAASRPLPSLKRKAVSWLIDGVPSVRFDEPEEGVSPGQACVLYDPETPSRVLGGGFIASTRRADLPLPTDT